MMIPKTILRNIRQRLFYMTEQQLQETLNKQNSLIETLKLKYSDEEFEIESFSIKQKIELIENELKRRELKKSQTV